MKEEIATAEKRMLNFGDELKKQNFITIRQDGFLKILLGLTSIDEIKAVT